MVGNILGGCLFESVLTIWCSSLLEDARCRLEIYGTSVASVMLKSRRVICKRLATPAIHALLLDCIMPCGWRAIEVVKYCKTGVLSESLFVGSC